MKKSVLFSVVILFANVFLARLSFAQCQQQSNDCAPIGEWEISVAMGVGTLTNPLNGGDNFPLVILPYVHYYQENFYIENNQLGYSFYQSNDLVLSAITQLNRESAFFTDWSPAHLILPSSSEALTDQAIPLSISIDDVSKRKWALDAGLQLNWFVGEHAEFRFQLLHDINSAYNGFHAQAGYFYNWMPNAISNSQLRLGVGVNWQSADLINYYYGIGDKDNVDPSFYYHTNSGLNPFVSVNFAKHLSQHWKFHSFVRYEKLSSEVKNSPLVNDKNITSAFIGVVYAF